LTQLSLCLYVTSIVVHFTQPIVESVQEVLANIC
jgi:hypothetical protein